MTRVDFRRDDLEHALLERGRGGQPVVLGGPPGAGKTTLLRRLARTLSNEGWTVLRLDLMGAASSPERFLSAALDAIPLSVGPTLLPAATEIRRQAALPDRRGSAAAVRSLFDLWSRLAGDAARPAALVLDEFTEIRSLAYFKDLRDVATPFTQAMRSRRHGTVLATSYPTVARTIFGFDVLDVRPLSPAEVGRAAAATGADLDAEALTQASAGWPRAVDVLLDLCAGGAELAAAWTAAMSLGGRLETLCRHTYETLLLRSRGYGISKAVLQAVAAEEGLNLTALCRVLGRTPGAVREYLLWLLQVDALRVARKRYFFVDPLVREWVRLHARGVDATSRDLDAAFTRLTEDAPAPSTQPAAAGAGPDETPPRARPTATESLIEID